MQSELDQPNESQVSGLLTQFVKNWKRFLMFYKKHRYISPFGIISTNEGGAPLPLRYTVHSIKGISLGPAKTVDANVKTFCFLNATFFSKRKGSFFGRTYRSEPLPLVEGGRGARVFETSAAHLFYCLTQVDDVTDSVLVIELEVKDINESTKTVVSETLVGWVSIDAALGVKPQRGYTFYKGTARNAMVSRDSIPKGSQTSAMIDLEIDRFESLRNAANLVPSTVMVGCDEILPGVREETLPPKLGITDINLLEMRELYIERVKLEISPDIHRAIQEDCRRFRMEKYEGAKGKVADVYIQEVKLFAYYHNGWTAVNREGSKNYIVLSRSSNESYNFAGIFPVLDVFNHRLSCLVVQIEVLVKIPLENSIEESMKVVLGWKPVFLDNTYFGKVSTSMETLMLGPGKTLNGDTMFELPGRTIDTKASLTFDINLSNIPGKPSASLAPSRIMRSAVGDENPEFQTLKNQLQETRRENQKLSKQNQDIGNLLKREQERDRSNSPSLLNTVKVPIAEQTYAINTSPVTSANPEFIDRMDKLIASVNELTKKQAELQKSAQIYQPAPPSASNAHLYSGQGQAPPIFGGGYSNQPPIVQQPPIFSQPAGKPAPANPMYAAPPVVPPSGEISRVDRATYIGAGVNGLVDPLTMDPALAGINLKKDLEDSRKISTITIQFLGIKYTTPTVEPGSLNYHLPERVFLTFDFFNFATFRTKSLGYMGVDPAELRAKPANFLNAQLALINEDFVRGGVGLKEPLTLFEINPLKEGSTAVHTDLVKYLATKELAVEVWDGDSLMPFGRCKTRLIRALRQGADHQVADFTLEIFDQVSQQVRGSLQLLVKNQGLLLEERPDVCPPEVLAYYFNKSGKSGKYKVKSFKPLDVQKELSSGFDGTRAVTEAELQDEDQRKRLRIDRLKVLRSQVPQDSKLGYGISSVDQQTFNQTLREIEAIRERKKPEVISNALAKGFNEEHQIGVMFGQPKYITYKFENVLAGTGDFRVAFDHGKDMIPQEFNVVRNPNEWERCCNNLKIDKPIEYGMLEHTDVFSLRGGESITLILKMLSYDETGVKKNMTIDKVSSLSILDTKGTVLAGIAFRFKLRPPIIDQTLTFREMESKNLSLKLPPFFPPYAARQMPEVVFSNPAITLELIDSNNAKMKVHTPPSPQVLTFYMFVYEDSTRSNLVALHRIIVQSQAGRDVITEMGQIMKLNLDVQTGLPRMARLFTDKPKILAIEPEFQHQFDLFPNQNNKVFFKLRSFKPGVEKVSLHCVDNNTKELIQGWTLNVSTNPRLADKTIELRATANRTEPQQPIEFVSRLNEFARFELECSNPELVSLQDKDLKLEALQKGFIQLRTMPQRVPGRFETHIYIVEQEGRYSECWRLNVTVEY